MSSYIIKRLIYAVIIAWGILTITFILLRVGPSSPVDRYILNIASRGQDVESVKQAIESKYGLNKPIYEQYFDYMGNLLQGKWGWSFSSSSPVMDLIGSHWIYSFQLILLATITNPPLCYSQHQICTGKSVTYYVTAVDAQGTQSEPAVVTI